MRVIRFSSENFKRLRAVEIVPEGDVVVLSGRNAQGKSSVLDAIWQAVGGGPAARGTSRPIRDGEKSAVVTLELSGSDGTPDLIVTRRWTEKATTLEVSPRPADGDAGPRARYTSPQAVLDALVGRLSFDPLEFAGQDARGQLATLLSVVDLPFDLDDLAERRRAAYDERTQVNRDVKSYAAQVDGIAAPSGDTPDQEVAAASIVAELEAARKTNAERAQHAADREAKTADLTGALKALKDAEDALADAKDTVARYKADIVALDARDVPSEVDVAPITERLNLVDQTNRAVRDKLRRLDLEEKHEELVAKATELTTIIDGIDAEKTDGLAATTMPVEGLSFDDEGVLYNGVPFSQASASEQLRVGVAVAMALNPNLRVVRIADGSLLDSEAMETIERMAGENDFQVWVERVDETGEVGVVIEDGAVVS